MADPQSNEATRDEVTRLKEKHLPPAYAIRTPDDRC
jgi:hypothetical protein